MVKVQIKYDNEIDKQRIIKALSSGFLIKKISKPYEEGKYKRAHIDVE